MNITFVVPCKDLSGGLRVIAAYGNNLMRFGHNVNVVYPLKKISLKRKVKNILFSFGKKQIDHLDQFHGNLVEVEKVTEQTVPHSDIIVATSWETAEWIKDFPDSFGSKHYLIQGYEIWNANADRVTDTFKFPFHKMVTSNWLKEIIEDATSEQDIPVLWNGKDFFLSESLGEGVVRPFDIGMVYSNIPNKNSILGIKTIQNVANEFPDLKIVMFGTDKPTFKLPLNVTFYTRPEQEKIRSIYLKTKIWLSTSRMEGFCLPALEAISMGSVVVSTNSLGVQDIINHGEDGYLVELTEENKMTDYVVQLMKNEEMRKKFQVNGLKKSENFSWMKSTEKMEKIFTLNSRTEEGLAAA